LNLFSSINLAFLAYFLAFLTDFLMSFYAAASAFFWLDDLLV